MKKILYIIPILLLSIFLVNNVYGASTNYSTVDELYNYFDTVDGMTYTRQIGATAHDTLKSSDLFISTNSSYKYYVIFGSKVCFFNSIPTIPYFKLNDTSNIDIVYLSIRFSSSVKCAYFSFNMDTGEPSSDVQYNTTGSSGLYEYACDLGYIGDFFTKDNFYNLFDSNFDLVYTDTGLPVVQKNPEFTFIPTYTENYESCNLKLDIKNAPDYYKLEYAINSSSKWYEFDNSIGVTVENNCLVIVRMVDENGDELFSNSYNVAILGNMLSSTYFKVDFDNTSNSYLAFTPILYNNIYEEFDCYFSFTADNDNLIYKENGNNFLRPLNGNEFMDWTLLQSSHKYYLHILAGKCNVNLNFKLVNKNTGVIGLERSFKFSLDVTKYPQALSSTTNGTKDAIFDTGVGSSLNNNIFGSNQLEIDWSVENCIKIGKSFFNNAVEFLNVILAFLSVLPAWITVPLYIFFILLIISFIIKFFRG